MSSGDSLPITSASVDGIALDLRLAHARQHGPQRGDVGGVRRDVAAARGLAQALAIQRLLVAHVEDERDADELDAALEALEVGDLAERGEVDVVRADR